MDVNEFLLQAQNRIILRHCYTWGDFKVSYLCGKSHFYAYEPIPIRFEKSCFYFNRNFTWFIFQWISFLPLSFWSKLDKDRIKGTQKSYKVNRWQGGLIWVWWCWNGWVYEGTWFPLIRYISSKTCIFVSFFLWRRFRWF